MESKNTDTVVYDQLIERGCGMDVHRDTVVVTVMGKGIETDTRTFGTTTNELKVMGSWLESLEVTHGAMESTGIYWKPVMHILREYPLDIMAVNARYIKNVPGRKTDKADSEWICKLLLSGLLTASFIPPEKIRILRDLHRYKRKMVQAVSAETNRMIRTLEDCNVKLSSVVSDVSGVCAGKLIDGLISGRGDLDVLVMECYHGRMKSTPHQIKEAITGRLTPNNLFILKTIRNHIDYLESQILSIEKEIDNNLSDFEREIELLQTIPGVGKESAVGIICEIGVDMDVYPTEHHLASHTGMCPGNNESAGKKKAVEHGTGISI